MKTIDKLLKEHPFFSDMQAEYVDLIAGCGRNIVFKPDEWLAREGDMADEFYVIRAGRVAIEAEFPGRGWVTLQTVDAGEIVGWSWVFPPYKWTFDLRARETVHVVALDGKCLRTKCQADKAMGYELMQRFSRIMAERLRAARLQMMDIYGDAPRISSC